MHAWALTLATALGCASRDALDISAMSFRAEPLVGKIVWNDLSIEDIDAARRFYGELFIPPTAARAWLDAHLRLAMIDVADAAESSTENAHHYFPKSPWVSSDMLMRLRFDFGPEERGLVRSASSAMSPADYIERLSTAVAATTTAAPAPHATVP